MRRDRGVTLVLVAVVVLSLVFAFAGYRSFWVWYDTLPDYLNAAALVEGGEIPARGCLTSFDAFSPPGIAWLYVPGVLLVPRSPGLAQALGAALLFLLTLLGIVRLLAPRCGPHAAAIAVVVFAASKTGVFYLTELWPRGHACFYVWTVVFLGGWCLGRKPWALAAALLVYAFGAFCFLEVLPIGLLFPVLWLVYRPPVSPAWVAAALLAAGLVWWPYLRFESGRDFADLHSMVRGVPLVHSDVPDLQRPAAPGTPLPGRLKSAAKAALLANDTGRFHGAGSILVFLQVAAVAGLAAAGTWRGRLPARWRSRLERRALAERSPELLLWTLSLAVPLLVMVVLTARSEDAFLARRFWWFWGLEPVFVGVFAGMVLPNLRASRWLSAALVATTSVCFFPTRAFLARVQSVRSHGYAGADDRLRAVDALARLARAERRPVVQVGYDLAVPAWQMRSSYLSLTPVGADYDTVLWSRHGIVNGQTAPGGSSPGDDFRLRELRTSDGWRDFRVPPVDLEGYERAWASGDYELWRKGRSAPVSRLDLPGGESLAPKSATSIASSPDSPGP